MNTPKRYLAVLVSVLMTAAICPQAAYASSDYNDEAVITDAADMVSADDILIENATETITDAAEEDAPDINAESSGTVFGDALDQNQDEDASGTGSKQTAEITDASGTEESAEAAETEESAEAAGTEEIVGAGNIQVGTNVTAAYTASTGELVLYSNNGTLWNDWISKLSGVAGSDIKSIKVSSGTVYLPADSSFIFENCSSLTSLDLSSFNTSNVTDMNSMFSDCSSLTSINLSSFNTSKVTDMSSMFSDCSSLTALDLSGFNTANVTDMNIMFLNCGKLKKLDLSSFNTAKVTDMSSMFSDCGALTSLNLNSFTTANVTDMSAMFSDCGSLAELNLGSFNTSKVTDMIWMFLNCSSLKSLDLSSFNTSNVTDMSEMFKGCTNLADLNLSSFDMSKVDAVDAIGNALQMFENCKSLTVLRTPKKNGISGINLPRTMYDSTGAEYKTLPVLSKSIALADSKENVPADTNVTVPATVTGFSDVQDPKHPYYKAIYWAANKGITKGYDDGTFGINTACTRGHAVMFLWRMAGSPAPRYVSKAPFKDVPKKHAYYKAVLWAQQKGITKGYTSGSKKGTFAVNDTCTRGQIMMFIWRFKGQPAPTAVSKSPFKDVPTTHAYYKAILWGAQKKVTTGYTSGAKKGTFGINEDCTRGAIVTFLYRIR